ncbi:MAG: DUF222 domain-containing protein [Proteobacteria bacterium]|nr:DUF222 domain-containing protein [Pseudomonadota bacterium]
MQRLTGFGGAVLAELEARGGGQVPTEEGRTRSLPGWAAEASGDSSGAAGRLLRVASALQTGLPAVAQAVLDGRLPFVRAEVLTRLVGRIDPAALAEAEPELLAVAQRMDPVQLAAYVRHQLATWVEPVIDDDERRAADRRYLKTRSQTDGSVWGSFLLPAQDSEALLTVLEPLARRAGDSDSRTAGQRRADALVEVCEQVLRHGELPDAGGLRPQLSYVLPADWAAATGRQAACPACGPQVRLLEADGSAVADGDGALRAAAADLLDGSVLAVKGLGGYHLACRADSESAVATLRARKQREAKPLAVMAPGLDEARALIELSPEAMALLCGSERPIVVAPRRASAPIAAGASSHAQRPPFHSSTRSPSAICGKRSRIGSTAGGVGAAAGIPNGSTSISVRSVGSRA